MMRRTTCVVLLLSCGCGSAVPVDGSSSSGDDRQTSSTTTGPDRPDPPNPSTSGPVPPTTGTPPDSTTSSADSSSEGTETENNSGLVFVQDPDAGPIWEQCDLWEQDCGRGFKCVAWAADGGTAYNGSQCVPLHPDPDAIGDPCTVEDYPLSGVDTCGADAFCFFVEEDLTGICVASCFGSEDSPQCPEGSVCTITAEPWALPCLPRCNPLDPLDCPPGHGCYPWSSTPVCMADASGDAGAVGEPCATLDACDPGLFCTSNEQAFCGDEPCCVPYCSLQDPQCPDTLSCVPFFEDPNEPLADELGACVGE